MKPEHEYYAKIAQDAFLSDPLPRGLEDWHRVVQAVRHAPPFVGRAERLARSMWEAINSKVDFDDVNPEARAEIVEMARVALDAAK